MDFSLRRPESIYYDLEICELSDPNSSHPEQATQVSALPKEDQVPHAPLEVPKDSHQDAGKGKEVETLKGKDKGQNKKKNSSNPTEKASDTAVSQLDQTIDPGFTRRKLRLWGFSYFCIFFFFLLLLCLLCCLFFKRSVPPFLLSMKISFFHLIHNNMCYKIHCQSMATFCHFNLNRIYCHIV